MLTVLLSFDSYSLKMLRTFSSLVMARWQQGMSTHLWICSTVTGKLSQRGAGSKLPNRLLWEVLLGSGPFCRRKYVCRLSLCPSSPLLSCSGMCWVTSLQAGLVGDSFIDFFSCVAKPELSFLESACLHLGMPTFVSAAKQSTCSRTYLLLLFFQLPSTAVFCSSALIFESFFCSQGSSSSLWIYQTNGCWISRKQQGSLLWGNLWNMVNGT